MEVASGPFRPSATRLALVSVCVAVALGAFALLVDVRFNYDDPVVAGVTDYLARETWTALLLGIEGVMVLGIAVLLLAHGSPPAWTAQDEPEFGTNIQDFGTSIQIGCPGCGTVFEKDGADVDEPHEQTFRCPNCNRQGRLRMGLHKSVALQDVACSNCRREFKAYRPGAECPHCHAPTSSSST